MKHRSLSVIVPAYNEARGIEETILEILEYFRERRYEFEILAVNDGSTDGTRQILRSLQERFREVRLIDMPVNGGKGRAVQEGVRQARHALCMFIDADNSTRIAEWSRFEALLDQGFKAVAASRHLPGSTIVHPQPFFRRTLGTGYRFLARTLFGIRASDFNCGFKAYETALARRVFDRLRVFDWAFDLEIFCLLNEEGVSVAEVPVRWTHHEKPSRLGPFRTAVKTLRTLITMRTRRGRSGASR